MGRRSKGAGRHLDQAQGKAAIWDAVPRSPSLPLRWLGSPLGGPAETQVWRVSGTPVQTGRSSQQRQCTQEDRPGPPGSRFLCLHQQVSLREQGSRPPHLRLWEPPLAKSLGLVLDFSPSLPVQSATEPFLRFPEGFSNLPSLSPNHFPRPVIPLKRRSWLCL